MTTASRCSPPHQTPLAVGHLPVATAKQNSDKLAGSFFFLSFLLGFISWVLYLGFIVRMYMMGGCGGLQVVLGKEAVVAVVAGLGAAVVLGKEAVVAAEVVVVCV